MHERLAFQPHAHTVALRRRPIFAVKQIRNRGRREMVVLRTEDDANRAFGVRPGRSDKMAFLSAGPTAFFRRQDSAGNLCIQRQRHTDFGALIGRTAA